MSKIWSARGGLRAGIVGAAGVVAALGLVACSSSPTEPSDTNTSSGSSDAIVAEAQQTLEQFYKGTETAPPTSGPKAVAGKNVWIVSCGQAVPGCSLQSNAAKEAAGALGWQATLFDGAFGANDGYAKGIRQAIAAKADGIIIVSIDCTSVTQALTEAKAANIKVVSQNGFACTDASLVTQYQPSSTDPDVGAFGRTEGKAQADWIIAQTKGKAKILNFRFIDNNFAIEINKGFEAEIAKCTTCSVANTDISLADYSKPSVFQQKASSALLGNPSVNAVHVPFDSFMTGGVAQAIVTQARTADIAAVGSEGFSANLNLIRDNKGQNAAIASDQGWIGWAAADTMNRLFAGEQRAPAGIGFKAIDATHSLPGRDQDYHSQVDFRAAYKAVWGV